MNRTILIAGVVVVLIGLGAWSVYAYVQQAKPAAPAPQESATTTPITTNTPPPVTPVVPAPSVHAYGNVTLALGQTARFADVTITPLSITEDSRCPLGVLCIQAGTVRVSVRIVSATGTSTQILSFNQAAQTDSNFITLTGVQPIRRQHGTIAPSEYQLTFDVEKRVTAKCYIGGCSSEVCSDNPGVVSSCIYRSEYACYKTATCERQASGTCGWTQTPELKSCIANASSTAFTL